MTRLKTNALRTISAAMLISVLAAVTGCSDRKPDIDYDLVGGTYEAGENEYKVQIFSDSSDTTAEAPVESETESATSSTPETTKSTTTKPAVTVSTNQAVTTPEQTVRTDLPKVTAEPQYTTDSTTTAKPKQTEPVEIEMDDNGFPANPEENQTFVDSTGTEYIYNGIFGWIQGDDGNPDVQEFPRHGDYTYGEGEQILH